MRNIVVAICLVAFAASPAGAAETQSEQRPADVFASCHGVFHLMTTLAAKGKYAKDTAANKATERVFTKLDKRVTELARKAFEEDGEDDSAANEALADAAKQHIEALGELTRGGKYTRAEMEEDAKSCYALMVADAQAADGMADDMVLED